MTSLSNNFVFKIFAGFDFELPSEAEKCFPIERRRGEEGRPNLFSSSILFGCLSLWKLHLVAPRSGKGNYRISTPECICPSCN